MRLLARLSARARERAGARRSHRLPAGRVGWGFVSDKVGRKPFYLVSTAVQAFAVGTMAVWISLGSGGYPFWLASFLIIGSL